MWEHYDYVDGTLKNNGKPEGGAQFQVSNGLPKMDVHAQCNLCAIQETLIQSTSSTDVTLNSKKFRDTVILLDNKVLGEGTLKL